MKNQTRRGFLQRGAAIAAYAATAGIAAPKFVRAQPSQFIRRDVNTLEPNGPEIAALRAGVAAMKALPSSNPRNWISQADIHRDFCPHENWYFLPWHRAYLYYFEQICRDASGDMNFALPYWNWTANPALPDAFLGDASNPLWHARSLSAGQTISDEFVGLPALEDIVGIADFETFASEKPSPNSQRVRAAYGELEATPHNNIHGIIGGDMGSVARSPRDPIFWLHHCNIDRLWATWNLTFQNTTDTDWLNFSVGQFFDSSTGATVQPRVDSLLSTTALDYEYDCTDKVVCPRQPNTPTNLQIAMNVSWPNIQMTQAGLLRSDPRRVVDTALTGQAQWNRGAIWQSETIRRGVQAANALVQVRARRLSRQSDLSAYLNIRGLEPPLATGGFVRVFFNCDYLTAAIDHTDPHYAGTIGFFDPDHMARAGRRRTSVRLDVTHTLAALRERGVIDFDNSFPSVQLLMVDSTGEKSLLEDHLGPESIRLEFASSQEQVQA